MSATVTNQDASTVAHARYIGSAVLYIGTDGTWSVGQVGQRVSEYQKVKFNGQTNIHDDTFEVTALTAEAREGGGYVLYLQSNAQPDQFLEVEVDAQGQITGGKALTQAEMFAAEVKYGVDLNGNGGLGDVMVLVDAGSVSVYIDGAGAYQIQQADGGFRPLTFGGQAVTLAMLDGYEVETVAAASGGGYQIYVRDLEDNVFELDTDDAGAVNAQSIQLLGSAQLTQLEAQTGQDLNARGDTALTADWSAMLKTAAVRAEVETQTANGAKINHAGLVKIVDAAIQSVGEAGKVGADLFSDLKAIAARGQGLFTAKDLAGNETGYLQYVFDKLVNGSKANNLFTGGTAQTQALGNLSADSSAHVLQRLESKWLLGKDLPNPTTQGDTANPDAAAASGTYKAFMGELLNGATAFDVNQGSAGTCYLLASIASVAQVNPSAINSVFSSNGTGSDGLQTWGVRFFDTKGEAHWVTANNQFVVKSPSDTEPAYTKVKGVDAQGNATQELWAPLIEKAYAQANELQIFGRTTQSNAMFAIEGGLAEAVVNVAGGRVTSFADEVITYNGNDILRTSVVPEGSTALAEYIKAINSGKVVFVVSQATTNDANGSKLFVPGHAYMAYDADLSNPNNTNVKVYNPWGYSAPTEGTPAPSHLAPFDSDMATLVGTSGISFWIGV